MKISVCMCTMNEEKAIAGTIAEIREALPAHSLEFVVTDSSSDGTPKIAESLGAKVIRQKPQGYGRALRESLLNAEGDIILTTDCDGTYPPEAFPRMIERINEGYDVVSGSRLKGQARVKSMKSLNEFGNRIFALMVSVLYGCSCTDATTGMRAFKKEVIRDIEWTENTGLSLELFFKPAALGYKVTEIPIGYRERIGTVKLNPWKGGFQMLKSVIKYKLRPIRKKTV